jgi:hypothetical protein
MTEQERSEKTGVLLGDTEVIRKRAYYILLLGRVIPSGIFIPLKQPQKQALSFFLQRI